MKLIDGIMCNNPIELLKCISRNVNSSTRYNKLGTLSAMHYKYLSPIKNQTMHIKYGIYCILPHYIRTRAFPQTKPFCISTSSLSLAVSIMSPNAQTNIEFYRFCVLCAHLASFFHRWVLSRTNRCSLSWVNVGSLRAQGNSYEDRINQEQSFTAKYCESWSVPDHWA